MTRIPAFVICAATIIWGYTLAPVMAWCQTPDRDSLAVSLSDAGRYAEAEPLCEQALEAARQASGEESLHYAACLNDLARIRYLRGNYTDAEIMHRDALALRERLLGIEHPDVAQSLVSLAEVVWKQRRFLEAEDLSRRAIGILESSAVREPDAYSDALAMLATALRGQGEYDAAESLFVQAWRVAGSAKGPHHLTTIRRLNSLAALYVNIRRWPEAEDFASRAIAAADSVLPASHIELSKSFLSLGMSRMAASDFRQARELFARALSIRRAVLGPDHHDVATVYGYISGADYLQGDYPAAMENDWEAFGMAVANYIKNSGHLPDADATLFNFTILYAMSSFMTGYVHSAQTDPLWDQRAADIVHTYLGLLTEDMFLRQEYLTRSKDPEIRALREQLDAVQSAQTQLYFRDPEAADSHTAHVRDSLLDVRRTLLAELSAHGARDRQELLSSPVSSEALANALPEGGVLIEYLRFVHFDQTLEARESAQWIAVVVGRDGLRAVRPLGDAHTADSLVIEYQEHLRACTDGSRQPAEGLQGPTGLLQQLWEQFFRPVENDVGPASLVFIAPDYNMNQLSFGSLMDSAGRFLIERYPIHYLASGRDLLRSRSTAEPGRGLFALGDPDFDAPPRARLQAVPSAFLAEADSPDSTATLRNIRTPCEDLRTILVGSLPATRREVDQICTVWKKTSSDPVEEFIGPAASEEMTKRVAPGHRVIHLATHGFFIEPECQEPQRYNALWEENRLMHSGLLLSGANLHGDGADEAGVEDGILSAAEVLSMDLSNTDLVVLSGCETGKGDPNTGQGVYGLRRSFLMAGAKTVLCSLWPVSDATTATFMEQFYAESKKDVPERLRDFAVRQIDDARRAGRFPDPYYWAPFITIGNWDPLNAERR